MSTCNIIMFTCNTPVFKSHVTVPETFYFPIFWFVNRRLTVPSQCIQRAFSVHSPCVHRSQFCVHRSPLACIHCSQNVHLSLTMCLPTVHKSFTVHSAFSLHCHSELCVHLAFVLRSLTIQVGKKIISATVT